MFVWGSSLTCAKQELRASLNQKRTFGNQYNLPEAFMFVLNYSFARERRNCKQELRDR